MPAPVGPKPPSIGPVTLPELTEARPSDVERGDHREQERFVRADFAGADLAFTTFAECAVDGGSFDGTDLRSLHLVEATLSDVEAAVFAAPRSDWRTVSVQRSRLGAVEMYESSWRSVEVTDCKLSYVNARGSTWQDVVFRNCVIDELDLSHATIRRVSFAGCRIGTLQLSGTTWSDADLRGAELEHLKDLAGLAGAWVSDDQLRLLAPLLAAHLQINVG